MSPRFTLLVCSCDGYLDVLPPLFTLLQKYWPTLNAPIVLNTETVAYRHPGLEILCPRVCRGVADPRTVPWSRRLRLTLEQAVHTDLVLLYLDDFYLRSPVNTGRLDVCLNLLQEDQRIANIQLFTCPLPYTPIREHPWVVKREKTSPYLFSLQAGLWRRERLLNFLRDHENPWQIERWGSVRLRRYSDLFFALADPTHPVFDYDPTRHGLSLGKWRHETAALFCREGIAVDLMQRGVLPPGWQHPARRRDWLATIWLAFRSLRPRLSGV